MTTAGAYRLLDQIHARRPSPSLLVLVPIGPSPAAAAGAAAPPPSAAVSVVDGVTGSPIAGVTVAARPGDTATVERAGYLRRDTIVARDGIISLWPVTVDETFVRTLVYSDAVIRNRLSRWPGTSITVPRDFPAEVAEHVRPWVTLVPSDTPALTVTVDPRTRDSPSSLRRRSPSRSGRSPTPTPASCPRSSSSSRKRTCAGRAASPTSSATRSACSTARGTQDLMFPTTARATTTFSADERVLLTMMYTHRRPGQVAPDNDQALGQAATGVDPLIVP